jgi:hypothetical protein
MNAKKLGVLPIIICLLAFSACRTAKEFSTGSKNFRTFTAAIEFLYQPENNAKRQSIKGQIRIVRDSIMQISLRIPLVNAEAARINITPDKFVFIDRYNKVFAEAPFDRLKLLLNSEHTFASLQQMFVSQQIITFEEDKPKTVFLLSKQIFNKEFDLDASIPAKYREINMERLMAALRNPQKE